MIVEAALRDLKWSARESMAMKKQWVVGIFLLLFVVGCAAQMGKPMVWMEKNVSLAAYKTFEMSPVLNETGKTFEFDVADVLTQHIKSGLREKGFSIAEGTSAPEDRLVIKSSLIRYEPGSAALRTLDPGAGTTHCTVKSALMDKKTGKTVGEVIVAKAITGGGPPLSGVGVLSGVLSAGADRRILEIVATDITLEIEQRVKSK
jgi:hypothetical protein